MPSRLHYDRSIVERDRFTTEDGVQVFQAYVGALERDEGFGSVKDWVYELMDWDNMFVLFLLYTRPILLNPIIRTMLKLLRDDHDE